MIQLNIDVDDVLLVLEQYDRIKIYRGNSSTGPWSEITDINTRLAILPEKTSYFYLDQAGDISHWYQTTYYKEPAGPESSPSSPMQGGEQVDKIGYSFGNYSAPPGEWGNCLTPDDMRYTLAWGVDMKSADIAASEVLDSQLDFVVENALAEFERFFDIDIRKKVYKCKPVDSLIRGERWREGVDYTDEDDPYDFKAVEWENFGFVQLRHHPVLAVDECKLYSPWDTVLLDLKDWVRIQKKSGQLSIFPRGGTLYGMGYVGSAVMAATPSVFSKNYPQGFRIDYTTGFPSSDFVPKDLRNAIGILAAINLLEWMGDGLMAGYSSSSVSLDNLSESFSSTQSATSAYFGARILSYISILKEFVKHNRYKHANINIGFIG